MLVSLHIRVYYKIKKLIRSQGWNKKVIFSYYYCKLITNKFGISIIYATGHMLN